MKSFKNKSAVSRKITKLDIKPISAMDQSSNGLIADRISVIIVTNELKKARRNIDTLSHIVNEVIVICEPKDQNFLEFSLEYANNRRIFLIYTNSKNLAYKRNLGVYYCETPWVLMLDSDEELMGDIECLRNLSDKFSAYYVQTESIFDGQSINMWKFLNTRIFKKNVCHYCGSAHERVDIPSDSIGYLSLKIINNSYSSFSHYKKKLIRKVTKERKSIRMFFSRLMTPLFLYVFNGGIRDKVIGVKILGFSVMYPFLSIILGRPKHNILTIDEIKSFIKTENDSLDPREIEYLNEAITKIYQIPRKSKNIYLEELEQISSPFLIKEI